MDATKIPLDMLIPGEQYIIKYRLRNTKTDKWARLVLLEMNRRGRTVWSGRPGIGNLTFTTEEVIGYYVPGRNSVNATWYNKKQPI